MSDIQECRVGRFYARDVKVVKTNLTSETLKSSLRRTLNEDVKTLKSSDVKCICRVYRFYTRR